MRLILLSLSVLAFLTSCTEVQKTVKDLEDELRISPQNQQLDENCVIQEPSLSIQPSPLVVSPVVKFEVSVYLTNNNSEECPAIPYLKYALKDFPEEYGHDQKLIYEHTPIESGQTIQLTVIGAKPQEGYVSPGEYFIIYKFAEGLTGQTFEKQVQFNVSGAPPLEIESIQAESITQTSANIRWSLNQVATGRVFYGTTPSLGSMTNYESSFNYSEHLQAITGLQAGTTYYYKVMSQNQDGHTIHSNIQSFTTLAPQNTCTKSNPTLTLTPNSFSGTQGDSFSYTANLKNNNQHCGNTTYTLSYQNLPAGIGSNLPNTQVLSDGAEINFPVSITSSTNTNAGNYSFSVKVEDGNFMDLKALNLNLQEAAPVCTRANPTLTLSQSSFSGNSGDSFSYTATLTNNNQNCPNTTYILSYTSLPSDFSSNVSNKVLADGASTSFNVTVNTQSSVATGTYTAQLNAQDINSSNHQVSKSLSFSMTGESEDNEDPLYPQETTLTQVSYVKPDYPNYLQSITEPVFGNKLTRVSDKNVFGMGSWMRHSYSKIQAWNANGSLISTAGWPAKILDGNTYELLGEAHIGRNWSNTDPYKTYNTYQNDLTARVINPDNNFSVSSSLIKEFSGYTEALMPTSETNTSNDDRYFVLEGKKSGSNDKWIIVYDQFEDQILAEKNIGNVNIDWVSMSQTGDYVVMNGYSNGNGQYQGLSVFDKNMNYLRHLTSSRPHGDLCINTQGQDVFVSPYRGRSYQLSNGVQVQNASAMNRGGHVSCRNLDRPGWAYITIDHGDSQASDVAHDEIFAVKLDGSQTVMRFGKTYTDRVNGGYYHQAQATVSRDGSKVLFASNWTDSNLVNDSRPPIFILEAAQSQSAATYNLKTDMNVYSLQALSKPGYLQEVIDPTFNTKITRITGDVGSSVVNASGETWRNVARHGYSVRQPWNADESILYLNKNRTYNSSWGSDLFLDGQTYQVLRKADNIPSANEIRWHPTDPNIMLLLTNSAIKAWNYHTEQTTTLMNFSGYSNTSIGSYTGNFSNDGKMVAVLATRNSDNKQVAFALNLETQTKYPDLVFTSSVNVDFITISPLGNYIVVNANFGQGSDRTKVYNLNGSQVGPYWNEYGSPSHFDVIADENGIEYAVGVSKSTHDGRIIKRQLSNGQITQLTTGGYASHASARSLGRPGWIYTWTSDSTSWGPYLGEILAVKLDGTRVERITNNRKAFSIYENETQPCPSPSGSRVIYASDWLSGGVPIQGYVVDFRHLAE